MEQRIWTLEVFQGDSSRWPPKGLMASNASTFHYCVAAGRVVSQVRLPLPLRDSGNFSELGAGEGGGDRSFQDSFPKSVAMEGVLGPKIEISAWIGQRERSISCEPTSLGYCLRVEGLGPLWVEPDQGRLVCLMNDWGSPRWPLVVEALLGPCLVLAMAHRGLFCLHASAAQHGSHGAFAFLGASGAGKSTLARELGSRSSKDRWHWLVDDITPFEACGSPSLLPHFPQLKLPPGDQRGPCEPPRVPLRCLVFLASPGGEEMALVRLRAAQVVPRLLEQGVASRLLAPALLEQQLEAFCALAEGVPAYELAFPRNLESLPEVGRRLGALGD